tara:strand:- start:165 stop:323 length:159 start_codon:yes stop_codon:yes gene_type:complete
MWQFIRTVENGLYFGEEGVGCSLKGVGCSFSSSSARKRVKNLVSSCGSFKFI